ncbi:DUF6221 family protein [Nonomuraea sp. NPDC049709]|uniref:DUF6221 family protein n=1 Tax=Nonomuraea sp. NPDC049709 TaxID=3154736 RepID=UPI00342D82BB
MAGTGTQAFWIDAAHEGTQEHYGEQLRKWRHAFAATEDEPAAEGVTLDPLHFALGAWEVATRPVADSPYVRRHARVLDATCHRPEEARGLLAVIELAVPAPVRLSGGWLSWQRQDGDDGTYAAPPYERPTALTTMELRLPLPADRLPTPTKARASGLPNLDDAQAALEALIAELNAVVTPFVRELEGGGEAGPMPEWLRTQIEADKATAESAGARAWRYVPAHKGNRLEFDERRSVAAIGFHDDDLLQPVEAIHIALHDPADVVARCTAELALLAEHGRDCPECAAGSPCSTLRCLAAGYHLRPGWRDEWAARGAS